MKHIISITAPNLEANLDPKFGRALWFCLYDDVSKETQFIENTESANAAQGAGIQAANKVVHLKAQQVFSGHFGPKAAQVLSQANIKMVEIQEKTSLKDVLKKIDAL